MAGNSLSRVMVCTLSAAPGMLNLIVSRLGLSLALVIAWPKEPSPTSSVVVTQKVAGSSRRSSGSTQGRRRLDRDGATVREVLRLGRKRNGMAAHPHRYRGPTHRHPARRARRLGRV